MFKKICNFIGNICMLWWTVWSNFRFRKDERHNTDVEEDDRILVDLNNIENVNLRIRCLCSKLYKSFTWTADGIDQLFDAITPPPQTYKYYLDGHLYDDCDGFHSLVYHCLKNSGIECYLLTANTIKSGHCILIYTLGGKWHVIDYTVVYGPYSSFNEAVEKYNEHYADKHGNVLYNGLIQFNYETGKFSTAKKPKN